LKSDKIKKPGLVYNLWWHFAVFSFVIILILWLLQIIFFNGYYESMKIREAEKLGNELTLSYNSTNVSDIPSHGIFRHGMIVRNINPDGSGNVPDRMINEPRMRGHLEKRNLDIYIDKLNKSGKNHIVEIMTDDFRETNKNIVYLSKITDEKGKLHSYILIQTPLTPTDATVRVLKSQLIIVSLIIVLISILISFFLARNLSRPIIKIKDASLKMSSGDFKVRFEEGGYREIDELAGALNYTAAELSKNEALRRDLIANVSHDLRTPLTIIKSYGEMIIDISGENRAKREEHVNVIINEADRLSLLVNDILDLSKIESGTLELEMKEFNISEAVMKVCEQFNGAASFEGYDFNISIEDNLTVTGNDARITQVIYNLVNNAVNYTGEDKKIFIRLYDNKSTVRFEVTDTGSGISEEDKKRVWERYYRASKNNKRETSGSGIGLAIVKNILSLHKADFGVESEKGSGSTFWFELIKA